jgi:hypothetical protein
VTNVYLNPTVNSTLSIDLAQPWTVSAVNALLAPKPSAMTPARRPYLWYDPVSNFIYERGGWGYSENPYSLWSFQPDGEGGVVWNVAQDTLVAEQYISTAFSAFTASNANFYSLGGVLSSDVYTTVEGFLTYGFGTSRWSNLSSAGAAQSAYSVQAEAVFIPNFGKMGLLAFLGGDSPPNRAYQYEQGAALVDMSNITIYDPDRDTWYHQTATGSIPPPRSEFCAVGSAPTDNGTYEM